MAGWGREDFLLRGWLTRGWALSPTSSNIPVTCPPPSDPSPMDSRGPPVLQYCFLVVAWLGCTCLAISVGPTSRLPGSSDCPLHRSSGGGSSHPLSTGDLWQCICNHSTRRVEVKTAAQHHAVHTPARPRGTDAVPCVSRAMARQPRSVSSLPSSSFIPLGA